MNQDAKDNAAWTGFAALLMLAYGYLATGWSYPAGATAFYLFTLSLFDWMLKIGGICLLATAVVCMFGLRLGLLLDTIVSGVCGLIMILCAGTWTLSGGFGLFAALCLIFGGIYINAARGALASYLASASQGALPATAPAGEPAPAPRRWFGSPTPPPPAKPPPPKAEAPHPATVRPKSLSADGAPPPEGYLAALAKEDEEPPNASYK